MNTETGNPGHGQYRSTAHMAAGGGSRPGRSRYAKEQRVERRAALAATRRGYSNEAAASFARCFVDSTMITSLDDIARRLGGGA